MNSFGERNYKLENAIQEPVIYLAKLMNLHSHVSFIRQNKNRVLPVLTGILLYRQLNHSEKNKILPMTQKLGNTKFLGAVQALLAQNIANPSWNKWCLSNSELREYFETNKFVSELLGTWFFTVEPKLEISFIVSAIFSVATVGVGGHALEASGGVVAKESLVLMAKKTGIKLSKEAISSTGKSAVVVTILASVMKMMTDSAVRQAKEELLRRGLLKAKEL